MADIISMLPDQILCHILSFLPTQIAAATSVLSKRWTSLWLSVLSLYFYDESYLTNDKPYHCFHKFISTTILARDARQSITKFFLQCRASNYELSDSDLNIWINAAIQRRLDTLRIELPIRHAALRKSGVFTCNTLVVLSLTGLDVNVFSHVDLPSLETLYLKEVGFPEPRYLMELLSGSPILKNMYMMRISYVDTSTPSNKKFISLLKLEKALILDIGFAIPLNTICNVNFLYIDKIPNEVPVFPNLIHMGLVLDQNISWHLVLVMLKQCPKLQILSLGMVRSCCDLVWSFPQFVPECLSSQLKECSIIDYKGISQWHFAKYVMQNSRVLRKMIIRTMNSSKLEDKFQLEKELSSYPRSSPICQLLFT